jgi:hypothetical protein
VEQALRQGAGANGFDTDLWTLPRVAQVMERVTGVHYRPGHVWKNSACRTSSMAWLACCMTWNLSQAMRQFGARCSTLSR